VKTKMTIAVLLSMVLLLAGCGEKRNDAQAWNQNAASTTTAGDHTPAKHAQPAATPGRPGGEVLEAFNSGGYTYLRLKTADGETWAAGPLAEVAVGSVVTLENAMAMYNFRANSLDRTFDKIWFASGFGSGGSSGAVGVQAGGKCAMGGKTADVGAPDFSGLQAPSDGRTIVQVHADRGDLAGQRVKVRAKVMKFSGNILGRNWLHLRDGTGDVAKGDYDLTVTTEQTAKVGDTVLIEGLITVDKDFGSGYFYTVIVEDASVTVEESL
jgi:hypothetical protein